MAHNIKPRDGFTVPVLTTNSRGHKGGEIGFVFHRRELGVGFDLNDDGTPVSVRWIRGEDLFALREMLNREMDQAAFIEPAPSRPKYSVGDRVIVTDPAFGRKAGTVTAVSRDGGLAIEGGKIDAVRVFSWSIDGYAVERYVSPVPR